MDAARVRCTEVEVSAALHDELLPLRVVGSQEVLPTAHVAVVEEHVLVTDGPEVGTRAIVAHECVVVILGKGVEVLPGRQVR